MLARSSPFLMVLILLTVACGKTDKPEQEPVARADRSALRAYHGAPPVIPHEVRSAGRQNCAVCHQPGQQVAGRIVAPITPHPTWTECTQCHVEQTTDTLFVDNNLEGLAEPVPVAMPQPFLPPYIPHRLDNFRGQSCETCHIGPGAPLALRPKHGARSNCRQCHVPLYPERKGFRSAVPPPVLAGAGSP